MAQATAGIMDVDMNKEETALMRGCLFALCVLRMDGHAQMPLATAAAINYNEEKREPERRQTYDTRRIFGIYGQRRDP